MRRSHRPDRSGAAWDALARPLFRGSTLPLHTPAVADLRVRFVQATMRPIRSSPTVGDLSAVHDQLVHTDHQIGKCGHESLNGRGNGCASNRRTVVIDLQRPSIGKEQCDACGPLAWVYLVPNSFSFAPSKIILLGYRECAEPDSNVGMAHQCARLISKFGSDAIASQPAVPPSELSHLCPI